MRVTDWNYNHLCNTGTEISIAYFQSFPTSAVDFREAGEKSIPGLGNPQNIPLTWVVRH